MGIRKNEELMQELNIADVKIAYSVEIHTKNSNGDIVKHEGHFGYHHISLDQFPNIIQTGVVDFIKRVEQYKINEWHNQSAVG